MLIVMKAQASERELRQVEDTVRSFGWTPLSVPGPSRTAVCVTGNESGADPSSFQRLPGVLEVVRVSRPYKLASREVRADDTVVRIGDVNVGADEAILISGPCSVETEARTLGVARAVKAAGAKLFRAGAFKPRSSPYSFQGLGEEGLRTLARVRDEVGMAVVTEVMDVAAVDLVAGYADALQVGARNMQNFSLLKALGAVDKPIILKRGLAASVDEWLMAAEYLLAHGNPNVVLCERGIRSFDDHARNTLDLSVVPFIRERSHLPIIVDPSHGTGDANRVRPMARAAIAAGAQGLLIEAHTDPSTAYSDAAQTIPIVELKRIARDTRRLSALFRGFGTQGSEAEEESVSIG